MCLRRAPEKYIAGAALDRAVLRSTTSASLIHLFHNHAMQLNRQPSYSIFTLLLTCSADESSPVHTVWKGGDIPTRYDLLN
jgi:hypothetical protein